MALVPVPSQEGATVTDGPGGAAMTTASRSPGRASGRSAVTTRAPSAPAAATASRPRTTAAFIPRGGWWSGTTRAPAIVSAIPRAAGSLVTTITPASSRRAGAGGEDVGRASPPAAPAARGRRGPGSSRRSAPRSGFTGSTAQVPPLTRAASSAVAARRARAARSGMRASVSTARTPRASIAGTSPASRVVEHEGGGDVGVDAGHLGRRALGVTRRRRRNRSAGPSTGAPPMIGLTATHVRPAGAQRVAHPRHRQDRPDRDDGAGGDDHDPLRRGDRLQQAGAGRAVSIPSI